MKKIILLALGIALAPMALAAPDGAKLYTEKTCWSCHGKQADKPLLPSYPKLAGQKAAYAEQQMKDIKSGARANGNSAAMKGIMVLVNDEEIKAIAAYLESLK
ncbi:MAG: c-type cytochrome [Azoarcus sp.]|jgi:cytochrome c|nr:c-type cytochrome [Azoarcus sp.]